MPSFRELNTQMGQWNQLRSLDQNGSGAVRAADVREQVDTDRDGALSDQELDTAGLSDSEVREQLRQTYADATRSADGYQMALFSMPEIDARLGALTTQRDALAAEGASDLASINSGGDSRTILNIADDNRDGTLSVRELRSLDRASVTRLAREMNVEDMDERLDRLDDHLDALEANGATPEQNALASVGSSAGIFDSSARALGRVSSVAVEAARRRDRDSPPSPARLQQRSDDFLERVGNRPEVRQLLDGLQAQGQLNEESFLYLNSLLGRSGPKVLNQVSNTLGDFLKANKGLPAEQRGELVREVLHDLAFPADIEQGNRATCAATSVQMKLAQTNPARYASLVTTLADGKAFKLGSGQKVFPNTTYQGDNSDNRTLSGKVVQNALMDFARRRGNELAQAGHADFELESSYENNGQTIFYDSRFSADPAQGATLSQAQLSLAQATPALAGLSQSQLENFGLGLFDSESRELERRVLRNQVNNQTTHFDLGESGTVTVDSIDQMLAQGQPVSIDIPIQTQGQAEHSALIVARNEGNPPTYRINSWGKTYEFTRSQLEALVITARVN